MTTLPPVDGPEGPSLPPPADIADSYVEVAQRASRFLAETMRRWSRRGMAFPSEESQVAKAFLDVSAPLLANPYRLDSNYGNIFSVWDRLLGTYSYMHREDIVFGIDTHTTEKEHNTLNNLLKIPFQPYRNPVV